MSDQTRFCSVPLESFGLEKDSELVCCLVGGSVHIIPRATVSVLKACHSFKTIAEHVEDIGASLKIDPSRREKIRLCLRQLAQSGLLISVDDLLNCCNSSLDLSPKKIDAIGFLAHNKVRLLERALVSYIENTREHGRSVLFEIVDDTPRANQRRHIRHMLGSLSSSYGVPIRYGGPDEKVRFAALLSQRGDIPSDVVEFALFDVEKCGCPFGANWNALLLATAGKMFLCSHHDSICELVRALEFDDGIMFTSGGFQLDCQVFQTRESIHRIATPVKQDIVAVHEELLGASLGSSIVAKSVGGVNCCRPSSALFKAILMNKGSIGITIPGVVGDSGGYSPYHYFFLEGNSRNRMLRSQSAYRLACRSRNVFRCASQTTITDRLWGVTFGMGCDNTSFLPPFFPVRRNPGSTFTLLYRICRRDSFFAHLPWAISHLPEEPRRYSNQAMWKSARGIRLSDVLFNCTASFQPRHEYLDSADNMQAVGRHLMGLGSLRPQDFEEFLRIQLCRTAASTVRTCEFALNTHAHEPDFWARDLRKYVGELKTALTNQDYFVPMDLPDGRSKTWKKDVTQRLVFKYGQLLFWWPRIMATTMELQLQETTLTAAIDQCLD